MQSTPDLPRCTWPTKPLDIAYHDAEWGVPVHDDRVLFEFLTLEGAQAGCVGRAILTAQHGFHGFEQRMYAFAISTTAPFGVRTNVIGPDTKECVSMRPYECVYRSSTIRVIRADREISPRRKPHAVA